MARRRFQKGSVVFRNNGWTGRFVEDVRLPDNTIRRVQRRVFLGSKDEVPTQRLARRKLEPLLAQVNNVDYRPRAIMTLRDFVARWEPKVQTQYAPGTWKNHQLALRRHLLPRFGGLQLSDISTESLQEFVAGLQGLSPASIHNVLKALKAVWTSAEAWSYVSHNPFAKLRKPRLRKGQARYFSGTQIQQILDTAQEPERTIYWILAQAGLRIGEALALRWEDFDADRSILQVRGSVWRGHLKDTKTDNSNRSIPVSPLLAEHLRRYRERWTPNPLSLLFANSRGNAWKADRILTAKLHPLLASLGIPRAGFHAFRHGSATVLDRLNAPMKVRQQRLGHANAELTLGTYTHATDEDSRQVAAAFDQVFAPKTLPVACPVPVTVQITQELVN